MAYTYAQLPADAPVSTAQRIKFLVTASVAVADTMPNATIVGFMRPGPLKDAWSKTYAAQADARAALAEGVSGSITAGEVDLRPRTGAACSWDVDVGVDGGLLPTLIFKANVNLATAICEISQLFTEIQ